MTHNLSGQQFNHLTVLERCGSDNRHNALWRCRCVCGNYKTTSSQSLKYDKIKSCGCKRKKHGHAPSKNKRGSLTYSSWQNMVSRCTCPSYPSYKQYQDRGISICKRWRRFQNFLTDMGERPSKEHTLDRWPDNNGNYEPGNCRWATKREQANNRVTNLMFEYRGQMFTLADLSRHTGVSKEMLRSRLCRSKKKWTVEGALRVRNHHHDKSVVAE